MKHSRRAIPPTKPQPVRRGSVDSVADGVAKGWAIDSARDGRPASLFLFIDDAPVSNFFCSLERFDIEGAAPGDAVAGFEVAIPPAFLDGTLHRLSIRFDSGEFLPIPDGSGGWSQRVEFRQQPRQRTISHVDGLTDGALRGWIVQRSGPDGSMRGGVDLRILSNGVELALVKADKYRPDVAGALDCDAHCGFTFVPPARFRDGRSHTVDVVIAASGEHLGRSPVTFAYPTHLAETQLARLYQTMDVMSTELWRLKRELKEMLSTTMLTLDDYDQWSRQYQAVLRQSRRRHGWPADRPQPLVSILCPVYRPRLADFRAAVGSVLAQSYANWELILVDDNGGRQDVTDAIAGFCAADRRIRALPQAKNIGISAATNVAIDAARGDYIALFDHDDLLIDVAVEIMMQAAAETGAKILYSDEDKIDDFGRFSDPNFKSSWNYRLLLCQNYVCHFLVLEAATLRRAGPLRKKYDGAQDHDLMLRLAEFVAPTDIVHVPEVVYHWRKTPGSTATRISAKSYSVKAGVAAVTDHLQRRGVEATVRSMLGVTVYDVDWRFTAEPSVTVVIPFREQVGLTRRCLETLLRVTRYGNFHVLLVDNWSTSAAAQDFVQHAARLDRVSVLKVEEPFNYARLNNLACAGADAELFVFMNNDVFVEQADWLRRLVDEALANPAVGAVGAKLVYPDRTVQHAGVILGVGGVGDHAYRGRAADDPFFVGRGISAQELSAVTAALMLCRASAFRAVGGFDEAELPVAYNDVDLCLKLRRAGYRIVYCPAVVAEHHESVSRGSDMDDGRLGRFVSEEQVMLTRWAAELAADPCYSPNFSREGGIFHRLAEDPLRPQAERPLRYRPGPADRTHSDAGGRAGAATAPDGG